MRERETEGEAGGGRREGRRAEEGEREGRGEEITNIGCKAFWNAPHPVENHAEMACIAALRCHHKILTDLHPKWSNLTLPHVCILFIFIFNLFPFPLHLFFLLFFPFNLNESYSVLQ